MDSIRHQLFPDSSSDGHHFSDDFQESESLSDNPSFHSESDGKHFSDDFISINSNNFDDFEITYDSDGNCYFDNFEYHSDFDGKHYSDNFIPDTSTNFDFVDEFP